MVEVTSFEKSTGYLASSSISPVQEILTAVSMETPASSYGVAVENKTSWSTQKVESAEQQQALKATGNQSCCEGCCKDLPASTA